MKPPERKTKTKLDEVVIGEKPTEKELKEVIKSTLLKRLDKPLKACSKYPTAKQLKQKFKLEIKPS